MMTTYIIIICVVSLITLAAFAVDKIKSKDEGNTRIPEMVLLSLCTFGGSIGALIGMYVLRHKTNFITKFHFAITVWLSFAVQLAIFLMLGGVLNVKI